MSSSPSLSPSRPSSDRHPGKELRLFAVLCLSLCACGLNAETTEAKVAFKDPSKPGSLVVYVTRGGLHIKGIDSKGEVKVNSSTVPQDKQEERKDGLRVLSTSTASFSLTVNENKAELTYGKDMWPGEGEDANFEVLVPVNTNLEIENGWGGSIKIEKVAGDIVIKGMNCEVELTDIQGATSVETMNGPISASFVALPADKPVSISSMNGEVKLRLPQDAKAKVRFRTHNGTILTDFPEEALKTTSENLGHTNWAIFAGEHAKLATQIAGDLGKELANVAREVASEIKEAADEVKRHTQEAEKEVQELHKQKQKLETKKAVRIRAPKPPRPPNIPAISGGKAVSGTLNGGGPEVSVTTMNGDITLRRR